MPPDVYPRTTRIADATELIAGLSEPSPETSASTVTMPAPMLAYECNRQGCCCSGWRITWQPGDLVRLGRALPAEDREHLVRDIEIREELDESGRPRMEAAFVVDDNGACRFLAADRKNCGVHERSGVDALPGICADFPVAAYEGSTGAEFFYDPVCPSVLDAIAASTEPTRTARLEWPYADAGLSRRAAHARRNQIIRFGVASLPVAEFESIRDRVVASLTIGNRPIIDHLHAIDAPYAEIGRGEKNPDEFALASEPATKEYRQFFRACLAEHGARTLTGVFHDYRRFLFAIPTDPRKAPWHELERHLRSAEGLTELAASMDAGLRTLQLGYLAHRHFSPFFAIQGQLHFAAGAIVHIHATALRYAAAFALVLRRPVDRDILKAALGTAEYVYRSLEIDPNSLPWFGLTD